VASAITSLGDSLRIQGRVIHALLMREIITRYGRHNLGFLWLFFEPMLFTGGVLTVRSLLHAQESGWPLAPFCVTGYATVLMWRNTIGRSGNAVEPNRSLLHHRNVRVLDLYLARMLLEIAGTSMSFAFLYSALMLVGAVPVPADVSQMLLAWGLLVWFSVSMALVVGPLATLSDAFERFWHVFAYLFLPASGAFFSVQHLAPSLQAVAVWVPTVTCTELLRAGVFGPSYTPYTAIPYVLCLNLALMLPGLWLIRVVQRTTEGA
jgi:capsular polysaccharide transport system permease protein